MNDRPSLLAPFRHPTFRAVWIASLSLQVGGLIQSVGAAWLMTSMAGSAEMVSLVQASTSLPVMIFALASGAVADNFDRRSVMLLAQGLMLAVSALLAVFAYVGLITPWLLLLFTFLIGCGTALNNPSWQASVGDMVPRSGSACCGCVQQRQFQPDAQRRTCNWRSNRRGRRRGRGVYVNAVSYLPLLFVIGRWQFARTPSALPPESLGQADHAPVGVIVATMSPNIE